MPDAQVLPDPIAGSSGTLVPAFTCSWTDGGSGAAWVRIVVLLPGPPTVDRMLKLIANADEFEIGDIERVEPTVEALLPLTHGEPA